MRLLPLLALLVAVPTFAHAKPKVKQCSNRQTSELNAIRSFLNKNLTNIMGQVKDLTSKEKKRLRKKIANVNLKCLDDKKVCKDHKLYGKSRNLFGAAVVICYDYHRKHGAKAYCELTDTVLHESAHAARVKKNKNHTSSDRVWRVGRAARSLCRDKGLDRAIK